MDQGPERPAAEDPPAPSSGADGPTGTAEAATPGRSAPKMGPIHRSYVPAHAARAHPGRRWLMLGVVLVLLAGGVAIFLARRDSVDHVATLREHVPTAIVDTCDSQSPGNVAGATARLTCVYRNDRVDYYLFARLGSLASYFDGYKASKNVRPGTCPGSSPTAKIDEPYHQRARRGKGQTSGELICVHGITNAHLAWSQPDQLIFATAYGNSHDKSGHCAQSQAWHRDDFGPRKDPAVKVARLDATNSDPAAQCQKSGMDMNETSGATDTSASKSAENG